MQLPPALRSWAEPLAALDTELAIALGPLVRQLDQLVTRQDLGTGSHGPLDGYDGITRHGSPTRLLVSEWALADAAPAEFLRRAANAELLYLAPAYQQDKERAAVAVLVDTGPDQLGAGRLVQLAALIVLLRRAAARGNELSVGILGDQPGSWRSGNPAVLLREWLGARRTDDPDPLMVDEWTTDSGEIWVLAGPRLAKELPGRRRLLVTRECAWDDGGSTAAEVQLAGDRVELALPRHDLAVRALRGTGVRSGPVGSTGGGDVRFATFTGSPRRLIARGNESDQLVALTVEGDRPAKPRRYRLPGPVVAAGSFSRRTVALTLAGDRLQAEVIGRHFGNLAELAVPLTELDLSVAEVNELVQQDLPPLYFSSGALIFRLDDRWWRLHPTEPPRLLDVSAVATSRKQDEPRTATYSGQDMLLSSPWRRLKSTARVIFGQQDLIACFDGDSWLLTIIASDPADQSSGRPANVPPGAEPFGLLSLNGISTLLCYTAAEHTIQLCVVDGYSTLQNWPGVLRTPSLHPFAPLLAVQLEDRVDVVNLAGFTLVASWRADE